MDYQQWNDLLFASLFNYTKEGKFVFLSMTKDEIIANGKKYLNDLSNEEIWNSFKKAIWTGLSGASSKDTIIEKAQIVFNNCWLNQKGYWDGPVLRIRELPPYFLYLITFTLPLTIYKDTRSYYDKCRSFFSQEGLPPLTNHTFNEDYHWNEIWYDFESWTNEENNGRLGKTYLQKSSNWVYVEKALSQIILTNDKYHKLFEIFSSTNLIPHYPYEIKTFFNIARDNIRLFQDFITGDYEESIKFVSHFIYQAYLEWDGERYSPEDRNLNSYTNARLFLSFKISHDEAVSFGYRLHSELPYPNDLFSNCGLVVQHSNNGYSNVLQIPFNEKLELVDTNNRWKAKLGLSGVKIFINGAYLTLSSEWYVETNKIFSNASMLLLCNNNHCDEIESWTKEDVELIRKKDVTGLPDNISLYEFSNPKRHLALLPFSVESEENDFIQLINGFPIEGRKYLNVILPKVRCVSERKVDKISIEYEDGVSEDLGESATRGIWEFPKSFRKKSKFNFLINNKRFSSTKLNYEFVEDKVSLNMVQSYHDKYENNITDLSGIHINANSVIGINNSPFKAPFEHLYFPQVNYTFDVKRDKSKLRIRTLPINDYLLMLLSTKAIFSKKYFQDNYGIIVNIIRERNLPKVITELDLNRSSSYQLNNYNHLGFVSVKEKDKYQINPPEFLNIPSRLGREVIYVGARSNQLLADLFEYSHKNSISADIQNDDCIRFNSNRITVLPSKIRFGIYDKSLIKDSSHIFSDFAQKYGIKYDATYLPSWAFYEVMPGLAEYENYIISHNEDSKDYPWCRKIFDPNTLSFIHNQNDTFDQNYSLTEYELNYRKEYRLWINSKGYNVDKNWGRYLVLKKVNKNYVIFDSAKNKLAIPMYLQLPQFAAKSIYLMCNEGHYEHSIDYGNGKKFYSQIFSDQNSVIIKNLIQLKLGQNIIEGNLP